jgi:hypothetical protein
MQVYCTNCGQPHQAQPGVEVLCTACAKLFEVPADLVPPGLAFQAPAPLPAAPVAAPVPAKKTNALATWSLVTALLCCVPYLGLLSVGLGLGALSQLKDDPRQGGQEQAILGIVLGGIETLVRAMGLLRHGFF